MQSHELGPIYDTAEPASKLIRIEEFTTDPISPFIAEFGRLLGNRIATRKTIDPMGFIITASLLIYDLQKGVDGFTGEPMKNSLVGRTSDLYSTLYGNIPGFARVGFSEEFVSAVKTEWEQILEDSGDKHDPQLSERPVDPDVIQIPIENIDQAKELILNEAKIRVLALDWQYFEITDLHEIDRLSDTIIPLILRNAGMNFQLNLLNVNTPQERSLLDSLPDNRKSQLADNFWLVMLSEKIEPEEAIFIRDWLWMKQIEAIANLKELPNKRVRYHFARQTPALEKAVFRTARYFSKRGNNPPLNSYSTF